MNTRGLTVVELLVVIGIITLLVAASVPAYWNFLNRYQLDANAEDMAQVLRLAQSKTMQSEGDVVWSVHLVSGAGGSFTLFQGSTFVTRDTAFDEAHDLPASLSLSSTTPDADISFVKVEGSTADTGTITLDWPGGIESRVIGVNAAGRVDHQ